MKKRSLRFKDKLRLGVSNLSARLIWLCGPCRQEHILAELIGKIVVSYDNENNFNFYFDLREYFSRYAAIGFLFFIISPSNIFEFETPGLNFINVLRTALAPADPERVKNQLRWQYIFTLLGSACSKAVRRMLMKLTLDLATKKLVPAFRTRYRIFDLNG